MGKFEDKISFVMGEYAKGKLHSSSGEVVRDRKQALAIAYSEARALTGKKRERKGSSA